MRRNKTMSPLNFPLNIVAFMTFSIIFLIINLVSLKSLGFVYVPKQNLGEPIFKRKLCAGNPGKSSTF